MSKLLKADFFRLFKSKLFLTVSIIAVSLPILTVLLSFGINKGFIAITNSTSSGGEPVPAFDVISGKFVIGGIYTLMSNCGLIIPIFAALIVGSDVSSGTLRNKVMTGSSHFKIYMSHLIVTTIMTVTLMTICSGITTGLAFALIDYGTPLNGTEGMNLLYFYILGTVLFFLVSAMVVFFVMVTKHAVIAIALNAVIGPTLGIICYGTALTDFSKFKYAVYAIPTFVSTYFTFGNITLEMFLIGLASLIVCTVLVTVFGIIAFSKKDLK